jgi:S-adenosylmethionine hydrolase
MKKKKKSTTGQKNRREGPIVLLTDFGTSDHYAGTMKGVILSINPRAQVIDLTHEVHPQNIQEAGYLLWASYRYFPEQTIFVAVVDPGVGSGRRILCLEAAHRTFIAPDNELLNFVIEQENVSRSYEILQPPRFLSGPVSSTFHGRDIFAPLAALLSIGKPVSRFGRPFDVKKPTSPFYKPEKGIEAARILHIDRFGNIITNVPEEYFEDCTIGVGITKVSKHIRSYAEAPQNHACLIVGSSGLIEVVVKGGSAAETLRADLATAITVLKGIT